MPGILHWRTLRMVAPITLLFASAACSDDKSLIEPEEKSLKMYACEHEPYAHEEQLQPAYDDGSYSYGDCGGGGGGSYNDGAYYGTYTHDSGAISYDSDINYYQQVAYGEDMYAFTEYSRDWSNPDAYAVVAWPAAAVAAGRAAIAAGRALARTPAVRNAVVQGARWAREVTVAVAASLLVGWFPLAYDAYAVESVPVEEFEFMFDYAQ